MNCLNFVFVPKGIASRERLDQLYNAHVKRFYSSPQWRKRFNARLWQHRKSLFYLVKHIPSFARARKNFEPEKPGAHHAGPGMPPRGKKNS
jgi:anaerobic magnesium-protoporphyrin IX monomethyl ester cyclase